MLSRNITAIRLTAASHPPHANRLPLPLFLRLPDLLLEGIQQLGHIQPPRWGQIPRLLLDYSGLFCPRQFTRDDFLVNAVAPVH